MQPYADYSVRARRNAATPNFRAPKLSVLFCLGIGRMLSAGFSPVPSVFNAFAVVFAFSGRPEASSRFRLCCRFSS